MTKNSIISQGTSFRIYDSSVETHDMLPNGTYKVVFSMFSGFSLTKLDEPMTAGEEKIYGNHEARLGRIANAYENMDRSLGVLMSGDKGMGKSLMIRLLAEKFSENNKLPVVIVDESNDGLADFIDTLGECVVVFDEFEKKFDRDDQNKFLSLFDGLSTTQRLYVVTVNELHKLNDYLVNRPGRFHYHLRFDYPDADEVREYLNDQAPAASVEDVEAAVTFSQKIKLNFDHLRAIAFELELGGKFAEVIGDLNIKRLGDGPEYDLTVTLEDGTKFIERDNFDLFGGVTADFQEAAARNRNGEYVKFRFDGSMVASVGTQLILPIGAIEDVSYLSGGYDLQESEGKSPIVSVELVLVRQNNYAY